MFSSLIGKRAFSVRIEQLIMMYFLFFVFSQNYPVKAV